jgi:hypothetical protein
MPAIWASFRNKMIDDAMISNFLQPQSYFQPDERWLSGGDGIAFVHRSDSDLPVNWPLGTVGLALPPWAHQFSITPFHGNQPLALIPITNTPTAAESKFGPQFVLLIFIGNLEHCIGHVAVVDEYSSPSHTGPIAVIRNARRSGHQNIGAPR